jgi:hypothetical protein
MTPERRAMMQERIEFISSQFDAGKSFVEIENENPFKFRKLLHKASRLRNLLWTFALSDKGVVVRNDN